MEGFSVFCHYDEIYDMHLSKVSSLNQLKIVAITETSGLISFDGGFEVIGDSVVFLNGQKIAKYSSGYIYV